jgi:hypothetical protein
LIRRWKIKNKKHQVDGDKKKKVIPASHMGKKKAIN